MLHNPVEDLVGYTVTPWRLLPELQLVLRVRTVQRFLDNVPDHVLKRRLEREVDFIELAGEYRAVPLGVVDEVIQLRLQFLLPRHRHLVLLTSMRVVTLIIRSDKMSQRPVLLEFVNLPVSQVSRNPQ